MDLQCPLDLRIPVHCGVLVTCLVVFPMVFLLILMAADGSVLMGSPSEAGRWVRVHHVSQCQRTASQ